jgi:hypothetical protein
MFLAGMYLQLAKWGQGIPEGATKPLGACSTLKLIANSMAACISGSSKIPGRKRCTKKF